MDVVRLRILTYKSVLDFGQYADMSVSHIIDLGRRAYLRWIYYNVEGISFCEEVLKDLNIKDKIEKPGKNPDILEQHQKWAGEHYNKNQKEKNEKFHQKILKDKYDRRIVGRLTFERKSFLQAKNQGKFKSK